MSVFQQARYTIQALRDAQEGGSTFGVRTSRAELLPAYGTRARLLALRDAYVNDHSALVRGAFSAVAKRIASLPWVITGEEAGVVNAFQQFLLDSEFGEGWQALISRVVVDFLRYDTGAFVEVIAAGDPLDEIEYPIVGLAALDPLRCYPTGDPIYPVIYWDDEGRPHQMHYTRVIHLYDSPETDSRYRGWGDCALARAISVVRRQQLMSRYIEAQLDDRPPPGILVASNISQARMEQALSALLDARETEAGSPWGNTVILYGLDGSAPASIQSVPFSQQPQNFDWTAYTQIDVDMLALALGVDRQEIWQLTSGNLGTSMQSEILNIKARGKTVGFLVQQLTSAINGLLPEGYEFSFEYRDETENVQNAQLADAWARALAALSPYISANEARQLLALNVPGLRDALLEDTGEGETIASAAEDENNAPSLVNPRELARALDKAFRKKSWQSHADTFSRELEALLHEIAREQPLLTEDEFRERVEQLILAHGGAAAWDALKFAGQFEKPPNWDQALSGALADEREYIDNLIRDFYARPALETDIRRRAELWQKTLMTFWLLGLLLAGRQRRYKWVLDPSADHCETCPRLAGQVHTYAQWAARGLLPKSHNLQCRMNCKCSLVPTNEPTRGNFLAVEREGLLA